jgi:alpha-D-glucose phosphate-specific phosphoglucomutase
MKFGTDGWRAIMCDTFTFENVKIVVQAIADYIKNHGEEAKGMVVGYDARFFSDRFALEAARVLAANGIPVYVVDRDTPTPVVAYEVVQRKTAGAIMFTASHNPPEYNGIKYIPWYGGPASPDITQEIEANIERVLKEGSLRQISVEEAREKGLLEHFDPKSDYMEHIKSLVDLGAIKASGLRIVYDPMYSTGRDYLDGILREAGVQLQVLHNTRDPLFGGSSPDPSEARLQEMADIIRKGQADIGLATDGDADRFGVIDSTGAYLTPNQVISLLLIHLVEKGAQGVVGRTVATTHMIDAICEKYGLSVHETPVGFKYICQLMRDMDVLIGGEESGGLSIGGHVPEKDGILAGLLVAEMRAVKGRPLTHVLDELMEDVGAFFTRRIDIEYPENKKMELMASLKSHPPDSVGDKAVIQHITIDGAKFLLEDGSWFLVRASGTEPLIRVYVEAGSEDALEELIKEVRGLL